MNKTAQARQILSLFKIHRPPLFPGKVEFSGSGCGLARFMGLM